VTGYSVYSQPSSVRGGQLLYPQSDVAPCRGDKGVVHQWLK